MSEPARGTARQPPAAQAGQQVPALAAQYAVGSHITEQRRHQCASWLVHPQQWAMRACQGLFLWSDINALHGMRRLCQMCQNQAGFERANLGAARRVAAVTAAGLLDCALAAPRTFKPPLEAIRSGILNPAPRAPTGELGELHRPCRGRPEQHSARAAGVVVGAGV